MNPFDPLASTIDSVHVFYRLWLNTKKDLPIRPSEMGLLLLIVKSERPVTPVMAAESLKVKKQMITTVIRPLVKKGYIDKHPSHDDGRSFILSPTPLGIDFVKQRYAEYSKTARLLKDKLGDEEFATFISLLDKASIILEEKATSRGYVHSAQSIYLRTNSIS